MTSNLDQLENCVNEFSTLRDGSVTDETRMRVLGETIASNIRAIHRAFGCVSSSACRKAGIPDTEVFHKTTKVWLAQLANM